VSDLNNKSWRMVAAVAAMVALVSVGCSKAPASDDNSAAGTGSGHEQAVAFAECMRSNGVAAFPDPDASGVLSIDGVANASSIDTDSAGFEQAIDACKDLEPPGFTGHERNAQEQADALSFAACIRQNGVPDFPDPSPDQPLVDTNRIPSAAGSGGMATLNAAMETCGDVIADQLSGP
jgi:hypothetical protein